MVLLTISLVAGTEKEYFDFFHFIHHTDELAQLLYLLVVSEPALGEDVKHSCRDLEHTFHRATITILYGFEQGGNAFVGARYPNIALNLISEFFPVDDGPVALYYFFVF